MIRPLVPALLLTLATPAAAQTMDHSAHGAPAADPHAGHDMGPVPATPPPADPHAGHHMPSPPKPPAATAGAPPPPGDHYADRLYPPAEMARARRQIRREHGGGTFSMALFDLAEYQLRDGADGFRWDGEAWYGGDLHRAALKTEGEATFGDGVEDAEIQLLYSRALDPYWDIQAGVRHDVTPNPSRTYATIGVEGLAPYWIDVAAAMFLSDKGDLLARIEALYDQRLTQRLILQPRAEFNFAAQDVPASRIASSLTGIDLGLRLRYEIKPEFAPYLGLSYQRKTAGTGRLARAGGEPVKSASFVIGVRSWF
jgi:copper resistance protein B